MIITTRNSPKVMPFTKGKWNSDWKYFTKHAEKRAAGLGLPDKLEFKPMDASDLQEQPYFIALDTETFNSNGNLICLCNSENDKVILGSPKKSPSLREYFDYLIEAKGSRTNAIFIVYNLKFDAQILLKSLGRKITALYLGETAPTDINGIPPKYTGEFNGLKIKYIPKKCLEIKNSQNKKEKVIIYDCMQFFLGSGINKKSDLDSVATKYLGEQKAYNGKYQDKQFPDSLVREPLELEQVVRYCQLDCQLAKRIMDIWVKDFYGAFSFYPQRYHSLGTIALDYLRTKMEVFPTFKYTQYPIQELAYWAYFGGRFEITERGELHDIYHYDIRSAYPYAMSKMPDFTAGKWVKISSLAEFKAVADAVGFYEISVTVNEQKLAPFMLRGKLGLVYCPRGRFVTHTTGAELKVALEAYDFTLHKISGYAFVPAEVENDTWLFPALVQDMYHKRMTQKNEGQKYIYKVIINSLYGKTAQAKPEPRGIFNPVICSYITGFTRAMLLDACKDAKDEITQLATDGIFSTKKLHVKESSKLGDYEHTFHPKMYVIMAGVYSYNTQEKPAMVTKSRGFELRTIDTKTGEKKVFDIENYKLEEENGKFFYKIINRNSVPASKIAMRHKGYSWEDIGKMEFREKEINLNGDNKRIWAGYLKDVHGHNTSNPINAEMIL